MAFHFRRLCVAASLGAFAFSALAQEPETATTGNMESDATSTQHPIDETPQHPQPPTPGDTTLQNEVVNDPTAAAPTSDAEDPVPGQTDRIRRATRDVDSSTPAGENRPANDDEADRTARERVLETDARVLETEATDAEAAEDSAQKEHRNMDEPQDDDEQEKP